MDGVRATIASLGGDADAVFRRAGLADQDLDPQSWLSYDRFLTLLEDVRWDISRRYLRASSGSLTALADMLCYSDLSNFSTAFRQQYGVSPREWRRRLATGA